MAPRNQRFDNSSSFRDHEHNPNERGGRGDRSMAGGGHHEEQFSDRGASTRSHEGWRSQGGEFSHSVGQPSRGTLGSNSMGGYGQQRSAGSSYGAQGSGQGGYSMSGDDEGGSERGAQRWAGSPGMQSGQRFTAYEGGNEGWGRSNEGWNRGQESRGGFDGRGITGTESRSFDGGEERNFGERNFGERNVGERNRADRNYGGYGASTMTGHGQYGSGSESMSQMSRGRGGAGGGSSWSPMQGGQSDGDHRGRGPKGYQRSDERIKEEVCDMLADHPRIDASEIDVNVAQGEVTLSGTVTDRESKRLAEDILEQLSGVKEVNNQLRVQKMKQQDSSMTMNKSEKDEKGNVKGARNAGTESGSTSPSLRH